MITRMLLLLLLLPKEYSRLHQGIPQDIGCGHNIFGTLDIHCIPWPFGTQRQVSPIRCKARVLECLDIRGRECERCCNVTVLIVVGRNDEPPRRRERGP